MRIKDKAEEDIQWYFCDAEAACGVSSNFGVVEASASGSDNAAEDKLISAVDNYGKPIARLRAIERTLRQLSARDRQVLQAAHYPANFLPFSIRKVFARNAILALLFLKRDELEILCNKVLLNTLSDKDRIAISQIRVEIHNTYSMAKKAYKEINGE